MREPKFSRTDGVSDLTHEDVIIIFGWGMTQSLANRKIEKGTITSLATILLATPYDAKIDHTIEIDLKFTEKIKKNTEKKQSVRGLTW